MVRWPLSMGSTLVFSLLLAGASNSFASGRAGVWRDVKVGLSINYPIGWHVTTRPLTTITQPAERFVLYAGPMPSKRVQVGSPRNDQALAIVMEQTSISTADLKQFPPRPKKFRVSHLGGLESFAGERWAERFFRTKNRAFYIFIWVGANETRQLPMLLKTLGSLRT